MQNLKTKTSFVTFFLIVILLLNACGILRNQKNYVEVYTGNKDFHYAAPHYDPAKNLCW